MEASEARAREAESRVSLVASMGLRRGGGACGRGGDEGERRVRGQHRKPRKHEQRRAHLVHDQCPLGPDEWRKGDEEPQSVEEDEQHNEFVGRAGRGRP
jgi:hypothetical protein